MTKSALLPVSLGRRSGRSWLALPLRSTLRKLLTRGLLSPSDARLLLRGLTSCFDVVWHQGVTSGSDLSD